MTTVEIRPLQNTCGEILQDGSPIFLFCYIKSGRDGKKECLGMKGVCLLCHSRPAKYISIQLYLVFPFYLKRQE